MTFSKKSHPGLGALATPDPGIPLQSKKDTQAMNRNALYLIIGVLAVAAAVFGYQYYQDQQKTGIELSVGGSGISIEAK